MPTIDGKYEHSISQGLRKRTEAMRGQAQQKGTEAGGGEPGVELP